MINVGFLTALGAFLSYAVASAIFWNFPHWLHKKKNISFTCAHISHRGGMYMEKWIVTTSKSLDRFFIFLVSGSAEGYENTLKNFRK